MIEDVKNILNKLIKNENDIQFRVGYWSNPNTFSITYDRHGIEHKIFQFRPNIIHIFRNGYFFKRIECSMEDTAEITYLMSKLYNIYRNRCIDEFKHSLD